MILNGLVMIPEYVVTKSGSKPGAAEEPLKDGDETCGKVTHFLLNRGRFIYVWLIQCYLTVRYEA